MATVSSEGIPDASYAPYLLDQGAFHILVSRLAKHTSNILSTRKCHILFVEDEAQSTNLFARKRLSLQCEVEELLRESDQVESLFGRMRVEFGPVVEMLHSLPDFHWIRMTPVSGAFVRGFGQAFSLDAASLGLVLSE